MERRAFYCQRSSRAGNVLEHRFRFHVPDGKTGKIRPDANFANEREFNRSKRKEPMSSAAGINLHTRLAYQSFHRVQ
jgi:hypothetical protein